MRGVMMVAVMMSLFLVVGCGWFRKNLVELSESDLKNAEATRVVAKNLLSTWKLNSGFIRGVLGERLNELPAEIVEALDELDKLADRQDELSDYDLGYSVGLRVRMFGAVVVKALKTYAPEVLKYLPALVGL
jgi:hypothetical protein